MKYLILRITISSVFLLFVCAKANCQITQITVFQTNMRSKTVNKFYNDEFKRIGANKVKGNSYLFKGNNITNVFTTLGYGVDVSIVFDTYYQQVSVMQDDKENVIDLSIKEVDSFIVKVDKDTVFKAPALFINVSKIDPSKKMYMQKIVSGSKYELYKYFMSELRPAAMDVAQSNIKEFEIVSEYYYRDMASKDDLVKIKNNLRGVKELFKANKEAEALLKENDSISVENKLIEVFKIANN